MNIKVLLVNVHRAVFCNSLLIFICVKLYRMVVVEFITIDKKIQIGNQKLYGKMQQKKTVQYVFNHLKVAIYIF